MQKILEPFESLSNDNSFWNYSLEGLAVFGSDDIFRKVSLQTPVEELAIAADSFHTKPLRQYLQSTDRYHVLGLTRHEVRLFEGNRHSLVEIELTAEVAQNMIDALGDELTEKHSSVESYGGTGTDSVSMHHGLAVKRKKLTRCRTVFSFGCRRNLRILF